ncbi:MAG: hypothetical protein NWF00_05240 [Candidatus Bathyarchaeota archaeon]|nr:hypothetical protein [Candidatus Bathyarchaeota archaeon]
MFVAIYAIFGITVQCFLIGNMAYLNITLALLIVVVPAGLTVAVTTHVAETNPIIYVKTMKVREYFTYIFWSLAVIVVVLWISLLAIVLSKPDALPAEYSWILPVFTFAYVGSALLEALFIGSSLGTAIIAILFKEKANKFYRLNARTYLRVASDSMYNSCNPNEVFCFTVGIYYLNELLKTKYRLQLKKGQELSNYFKTTAFAGNKKEKQRVKQATDSLVDKLKKDMGLNDIVKATHNIYGKPTECTLDEEASELDYEIGIKKWFTEHIGSIGLIIAIVSIVVPTIQALIK